MIRISQLYAFSQYIYVKNLNDLGNDYDGHKVDV